MGLQGNKATHDFLSLYAAAAKDSSIPCSKPLPPPAQAGAGFFLKTHDFLQPLERPSQSPPPPPPPPAGAEKQLHQHALPGGIGTYSIGHAVPAAGAVKQEPPPFALWGQAAAADPRGLGDLKPVSLVSSAKRGSGLVG